MRDEINTFTLVWVTEDTECTYSETDKEMKFLQVLATLDFERNISEFNRFFTLIKVAKTYNNSIDA